MRSLYNSQRKVIKAEQEAKKYLMMQKVYGILAVSLLILSGFLGD